MAAVELSLFYFVNDATRDGYVLWGEGVIRNRPASRGVHSEALGDGLRLMRVLGAFDDVAKMLQQDVFPYRRGGSVTENIQFGFSRRPPIMAVPPHPALHNTSAGTLHHFVRARKSGALGMTQRPSGLDERRRTTRLLESLERHVAVDFRSEQAARFLGDVVLVDEACLRAAPAKLEGIKPDQHAAPEALRITIDPRVAGHELAVNVRLTGSDNAVLDDVLIHWRAGMAVEFDVPVNQRFGGAEVRAWRDGHLVWQTDLAFILEVGLNMNLVGRTVMLHDRLTELLQGSIQAGLAPASMMDAAQRIVQQSHGNRSVVGADRREPWRTAAIGGAAEVFALSPPPPRPHEYFPQGGHGRAGAILAFASLLEDQKAFLVDPFFDALGAEALLPRLGREADLTVITSLPDGADDERLRSYLRQVAPLLPSKLKVHRVTRRESREQAFHDRYLVIMRAERAPRGFLLSNSFSGAARQYPLVVAEMSPPTTVAVLDDIEGLLTHRNIENLWPPPTTPHLRHEHQDRFGKAWRFYLERLVPRAGRTTEDWLRAARAAGWLDIESDGNPRWSTKRRGDVLDRLLGRAPSACWLRRLSWHQTTPRLPAVGQRVAALGERAARGLGITPVEVAARLHRAAARDLEAFLRTDFQHPEQQDRRRGWLDNLGMHQALRGREVSLESVRVGLALWSAGHGIRDLHKGGHTFVYRVLIALDADAAFRVGVDLGDPDLLVAALDPWGLAPWRLALTRAALRSLSPMVRALGAQSLVAPHTRGNFGSRATAPSPEALGKALIVLRFLDRPTAALCAVEWGVHSGDGVVRRALAEVLIDRLVHVPGAAHNEVFRLLIANAPFLDAVADVAQSRGGPPLDVLVNGLLRTLATAANDRTPGSQVDAAESVARILVRAAGASAANVESAKRRVLAAFDVDVAKARAVPLSPFRRHPGWREAVAGLAWAQLLCRLVHQHVESEDGVESFVSFGHVSEVSPELLAHILGAHVPGLGALGRAQ